MRLGVRENIAIKMLIHERAATVGAMLSVVSIVFLVGMQLAIFFGLIENIGGWLKHTETDFVVAPKNNINAISASLLPKDYRDRIMGLKDIAWVKPIYESLSLLKDKKGKSDLIQLIGVERPQMRGGPWSFYKGSLEDLLDYRSISFDKIKLPPFEGPPIGQRLTIGDGTAILSAVTENVRGLQGPRAYTNTELAAELANMNPLFCNLLLVKANSEDKAELAKLHDTLKAMLPQATVYTKREMVNSTVYDTMVNTGSGVTLISSIVAGVLIGLVIILLTFYSNIMRFTKDFAVIHALGARKKDMFYIMSIQNLLISSMGIILGFIFLAFMLFFMERTKLGTAYPLWFLPIQIIVTYLLCFAGSYYAMRKIMQIEPSSVFR